MIKIFLNGIDLGEVDSSSLAFTRNLSARPTELERRIALNAGLEQELDIEGTVKLTTDGLLLIQEATGEHGEG